MPARREVPLVERDAEVAELGETLAEARAGTGRLAVVEGPAGIGKTRLMGEVRATARRLGMRVLGARATELERDYPFGVVRQLFEPELGALDTAARSQLLDGAAGRAGPVVGLDAELPDGEAGGDPSFATLNALYWLTSNLAELEPRVLLVDDAHWCDVPSLRFLSFLHARLEDLPVAVVVATRPSDALASLIADASTRVVRPRPLTGAAVSAIVREALSADATDEFCAACAEVSGGNPFLLGELLAELTAEGATGSAGEAQRLNEIAPATISRQVVVRLAALPEVAGRLARAAAVLGDGGDIRYAAALAGLDDAEVTDAAGALAGAGILEPDRPLRFSHPIVRTVIHADLPAPERAALHERAAALMAAERLAPERIAVHLLATEPGRDPAVAETLLTAARRALDRGAPEASVSWLRRALLEPVPAPVRTTLLQQLLTAGFRTTDPSALDGIDPVSELTADPVTLIESATPLSMWLFGTGRVDEMEALLDRAVEAARAAGDMHAAMRFEAQRCAWTQLPPPQTYARLEPYAHDLEPGSASERLWLAVAAWWESFKPGGSADAAADMAARALESGEIFVEITGLPHAAQSVLVLLRAERLDLADRAIERFASASRARGTLPELAGAAYLRGELARIRGDVTRAAADARSVVEAGRQGGFLGAFPTWIALLLETLIELGDLDAADAELEATGMTGELPRSYWFTPGLLSRGRLRLEQGRAGEAVDDLLAGARDLEHMGMVNVYYPWAALAARALALLDRGDEARETLERAMPVAEAWGARAPLAALHRARGLVSGGEEGIQLLARAVELAPAGLERLHCLADYGAALRRANRRREARAPLREALELARRGGALAVARRAHAELVATGERVRPVGAAGVEALTPSEQRVVSLAAEGQTNREIAQALFLTVKTVETHLSNAYRKLDIRSRQDLAGAL